MSKSPVPRGKALPQSSFARDSKDAFVVELDLLDGLLPFAVREVQDLKGVRLLRQEAEALELVTRDLEPLLNLRSAVAAYLVTHFDVPRPKALLGDEHFRRLLASLETVRALQPAAAFTSFRFGAAGSDSAVFERVAKQLGAATGLAYDPEEGDLLLRVRPGRLGWDVLTRLSPRPLSARTWRVCNLTGGLNATVAVAMNELGLNSFTVKRRPSSRRYLNAMCGSGTLLIERALDGLGGQIVGCDIDPAALACAKQNVRAAGVEPNIDLYQADATALPFADDTFDTLTADLPWGDAVGSHAGNAALYPTFLKEMARIAAPDAALVVLTHEVKLFERVLAEQKNWRLERQLRVLHGGHYPRMYLLTPQRR